MISRPDFGFATTATEVAEAFGGQIRGKTVIITGVSPFSIGSGLAIALASQSPKLLILASRTFKNIQDVTRSIIDLYPETLVREVVLDLSDLKSVRAAAEEINKIVGNGEIDVLINNAGINVSWRELTVEGTELQFATNHLGGFLLTNLLLPLLLKSKGEKRVINTSSEGHRISPVRFSDINQTPGVKVADGEEPRRGMPKGILRSDGGYEPAIAYGQSKSANVLFSVELNERFARSGSLSSFAVSPGNIITGLVRGVDEKMLEGMLQGIPNSEWKTVDQGAATLVVAGFDPKLNPKDGVYLDDCQMKRPSKWASDPEKALRLWRLSEELGGEKFRLGKGSKL